MNIVLHGIRIGLHAALWVMQNERLPEPGTQIAHRCHFALCPIHTKNVTFDKHFPDKKCRWIVSVWGVLPGQKAIFVHCTCDTEDRCILPVTRERVIKVCNWSLKGRPCFKIERPTRDYELGV